MNIQILKFINSIAMNQKTYTLPLNDTSSDSKHIQILQIFFGGKIE